MGVHSREKQYSISQSLYHKSCMSLTLSLLTAPMTVLDYLFYSLYLHFESDLVRGPLVVLERGCLGFFFVGGEILQ